MPDFFIAAGTAFWLGILTSISPCPLATNIAAVSYIGRRVDSTSSVLYSGLLYTAGRTLAYTALGIILVNSLLSAPGVSHFLQNQLNSILGPILILTGMVLLNLLSLNLGRGNSFIMTVQKKLEKLKFGSLLLGILFALSFCPVSAALFFGSLLPLALHRESGIALPMVYGLATGLPVFIFAILLSIGAGKIAVTFNRLAAFERWARFATGILFICIGIYMCFLYIYHF